MRYLSLCSGIEAATVAWHPMGWEPAAFAEIEAFPAAVLKHQYPNTPNLGDMTKWREWNVGAIDLLVGGTPCQSFSVAGLRKGLSDPRGGLMLTFLEIAQSLRPRWVIWENVPGVLSSAGGRDFGSFLGALGQLGYGWAYRVLDAQWCRVDGYERAVPQRRRRVFVVGCLGDQARAAQVLFERQSVERNPAPRGKARQGASADAEDGARAGGCYWDGSDCAATLTKQNAGGGQRMPDKANFGAVLQPAWPAEVAPTLTQAGKGTGAPGFSNQEIFSQGCASLVPDNAVPFRKSLRAEGHDASEDGTGRGVPLTVAFHPTQDPISSTDGTTHAMGCGSKQGTATVGVATIAPSLTASNDPSRSPQSAKVTQQIAAVHQATMVVRRLTPVECSRLQGFPDDYLELNYANAEEAHAAQVLHELWREVGTQEVEEQGWRTGISAALLAPQILLAGVHGGWISWSMAERCAAARGSLPGESHHHEGFLRALRKARAIGCSPYGRESIEQLLRESESAVSFVPSTGAQARAILRSSGMWTQAQAKWPLRYAFSEEKARRSHDKLNPDGPRYKALGNSMAVNCMRWIGRRIDAVENGTELPQ